MRDIFDSQVDVSKVSVGCELFDVLNSIYTDELTRKSDKRAATNARSTEILNFVTAPHALCVVDGSSCSHANNNGFVKPR